MVGERVSLKFYLREHHHVLTETHFWFSSLVQKKILKLNYKFLLSVHPQDCGCLLCSESRGLQEAKNDGLIVIQPGACSQNSFESKLEWI